MMIRTLVIGMAAVLAMMLIAACGQEEQVSEPTPTVTPAVTVPVTQAELLPVFVADDAEINLAQALQHEVGGILQLIRNTSDGLPYIIAYGPGQPDPGFTWPSRQNVVYHVPLSYAGQRYVNVTLDGIKVVDFGPIAWTKESVVKTDTVSHTITSVSIPADTDYSRTFTYSFEAVETVEKSTTEGLEAEAKVKLGPEYASFDFSTKVKYEAEQKFGQETTFKEDDSQTLSFKGPRHIKVEAVRDRQILRRDASSQPWFDYSICIETQYEQVARACWDSKAQFVSWIQGKADDNVGGVQFYDGSRATQFYQTAPNRRARPQPNAQLPHGGPDLVATASYINVTNQSIQAVDLADGEVIGDE